MCRKAWVASSALARSMLTLMTESAIAVYREACEGLSEDEMAEFMRIGCSCRKTSTGNADPPR